MPDSFFVEVADDMAYCRRQCITQETVLLMILYDFGDCVANHVLDVVDQLELVLTQGL